MLKFIRTLIILSAGSFFISWMFKINQFRSQWSLEKWACCQQKMKNNWSDAQNIIYLYILAYFTFIPSLHKNNVTITHSSNHDFYREDYLWHSPFRWRKQTSKVVSLARVICLSTWSKQEGHAVRWPPALAARKGVCPPRSATRASGAAPSVSSNASTSTWPPAAATGSTCPSWQRARLRQRR